MWDNVIIGGMFNPHQIQRVEDKRIKHWFGVKNMELNEFILVLSF